VSPYFYSRSIVICAVSIPQRSDFGDPGAHMAAGSPGVASDAHQYLAQVLVGGYRILACRYSTGQSASVHFSCVIRQSVI